MNLTSAAVPRRRAARSLAPVLAPVIAAAATASAGGPAVSPVAVNGDTLPGGVGGFSNFVLGALQLNDSGVVGFVANISGAPGGGNQGVFTGTTAGTSEIALKNAPVPGGDGQFDAITPASVKLNALGEVVFRSTMFNTAGGFLDNDAIFFHDGSGLSVLAREGQTAPEGTYASFSGFSVELNDSSDAVFRCNLNGTDDPTFNDTVAIVRKNGAAQSFVVQGGNGAFAGPGVYQPSFNENSVQINNAGQVLFHAFYTGPGVLGSNDSGYSRSTPNIEILREGSPLGGGTFIGTDPQSPKLNDNGNTAIEVSLVGVPSGTALGIVLGNEFAGRGGDPVPGGGTLSGVFSDPDFNNLDQVAYWARIDASPMGAADDEAVIRAVPGTLTVVAREGQLAPDAVSVIDILATTTVRTNDAGQVVFLATLNDAGAFIDAIFLYDDALGLIELVREGDPLAGSTIQSIDANLALNNAGQAAFTGTLASLNRAFLALTDPLAPPQCPADLAEPFGQLDFSDVVAFLVIFGDGCP